jgi:S-adenosylmethionine decarboxylase
MQGLHLTADLTDCQCDSAWLTDAARLGAACVQAVQAAGLQSVAQLFHTWPEQRGVTLDVYVCNFGADHSAKAHALMDALLALFSAGHIALQKMQRGQITALV